MSGDLENRFKYHHPLTEDRVQAHERVRNMCYNLALAFSYRLPDGREKSLVLTKIEEVMFWANAAIARMPDFQEGTPDDRVLS